MKRNKLLKKAMNQPFRFETEDQASIVACFIATMTTADDYFNYSADYAKLMKEFKAHISTNPKI